MAINAQSEGFAAPSALGEKATIVSW